MLVGPFICRFLNSILEYLEFFLGKNYFLPNYDIIKLRDTQYIGWVRSCEDKISTTCYYIFIRGNFIFWKNKKYIVLTRSSK